MSFQVTASTKNSELRELTSVFERLRYVFEVVVSLFQSKEFKEHSLAHIVDVFIVRTKVCN